MSATTKGENRAKDAELAGLIAALKEEGIEKGRQEAGDIIEKAKRKAAGIVDEARTEAEHIEEEARQKAKVTRERLESQLELALRDFLLRAKAELEKLVALKPLRAEVDKAMSDQAFIKKLISEMLSEYVKSQVMHESRHLHITIPEKMKGEFVKEWIDMMRRDLSVRATLHAEKDLSGFSISAEGEGGVLIVDTDSIVEALKPFVSERFQYILDKGVIPRE